MPSAGLEPAVPQVQRLQTDALERTATGIGTLNLFKHKDHTLISGIFAKGNIGVFLLKSFKINSSFYKERHPSFSIIGRSEMFNYIS